MACKGQQEDLIVGELLQIPDFILGKIFSFLDNDSKFNVALTCTRFNNIVKTYPEVYKTFELIYNPWQRPSFEIPEWTRPVPTVKFVFRRLVSKEQNDEILKLFKNVGKFVKRFHWKGGTVTQEILYKILNEIPNAEVFCIFASIHEENCEFLDSFEVKNQFQKLQTLEIYYDHFGNGIATDILDQFFGNARNVSCLRVYDYLNLLYNKPKLETIEINLRDIHKIVMRKPSDDYQITGNVKELSIFDNTIGNISGRILENFEKFILAQNGIEKFHISPPKDAESLRNIIQHVISLKTLKSYKLEVLYSNETEIFFQNLPQVEELRIKRVIQHQHVDNAFADILPFFPNLKRLHVSQERVDHEAINQLKLLEELFIDLAPGCEKLDVKNVKKLVVFHKKNELDLLNECGYRILKNHPNIVDFTWVPQFYLSSYANLHLTDFLKTFTSLKRFCFYPFFDYAEREDILKFLQTLVNGVDALETLAIRITVDKKGKEAKQIISNYFHSNRPTLKLEFLEVSLEEILNLNINSNSVLNFYDSA